MKEEDDLKHDSTRVAKDTVDFWLTEREIIDEETTEGFRQIEEADVVSLKNIIRTVVSGIQETWMREVDRLKQAWESKRPR